MRYTLYLFDFDYTLADSSRGIVLCFRHVLQRHGYDQVSDEQIKRTIGKTLEESFSLLTGQTDVDVLAGMKSEYTEKAAECMTANTVLYPETKSVLQVLKEQGARLGILSTKYRFRIRELVDREFPAGFFDVIIGGEDVQAPKPSPEGLLKALEQLGVDKAHTLYVGDSVVDALTAQAAGVDFAGVLHGVTTREELQAYPHQSITSTLSRLPGVKKGAVPEPKKWIAIWQLPILYFLGAIAWDEIVYEPMDGFPVFPLIFLLVLWWIFRKRRILPMKMSRRVSSRFLSLQRRWHLVGVRMERGKTIPPRQHSRYVCRCCGEIYQGNFCPRCGQSSATARYRLSNALKNIAGGFFNIDNGFGRTLIDLLYRPGHLMREFVQGKRALYFRPFQMLFILAAIYIMAVQLIDPDSLKRDKEAGQVKQEELMQVKTRMEEEIAQAPDSLSKALLQRTLGVLEGAADKSQNKQEEVFVEDDDIDELEDAQVNGRKVREIWSGENSLQKRFERLKQSHPFVQRVVNLLDGWFHGNKAFLVISTLPLFAIASRIAFRKRQFRPRFNLTEHLFVQAFIACQLLIVSILALAFQGHAEVDDLYQVSLPGIFVIFCADFKQLYGCSAWTAFWRTFKMGLYAAAILLVVAILGVSVFVGVSYLMA